MVRAYLRESEGDNGEDGGKNDGDGNDCGD